ncbi:ESX secretion-associated protein EspG [Nocardia sp. NPDC004168]|uniref:ESX secretion-associated protein EspG n=1 Tax=Nocardia sp. NPDC004168 TaxID=3154452 RepID=UPI0033AC2FEB
MAEWTWDPDDFAALWYGDAHDRIPSPLRYTSRFAFRDDFAAHRAAVWQRYSADELDEIAAAFRTLGDSDLRIEILGGTCKHKNSTGPDDIREYRILGARDTYRAVVLSQAGNQHEHGPIRARLFPAEQLPARLVNAIPPCAPGAEKPATFHPDDLVPRRDTYLQDNARNTPREQYQRLLGRPVDGGGTAVLITAPLHTHTKPTKVLQWHDITTDGRYTEHRTDHITVRPTTPTDLTTHFTTWIDQALQRLEAARPESW